MWTLRDLYFQIHHVFFFPSIRVIQHMMVTVWIPPRWQVMSNIMTIRFGNHCSSVSQVMLSVNGKWVDCKKNMFWITDEPVLADNSFKQTLPTPYLFELMPTLEKVLTLKARKVNNTDNAIITCHSLTVLYYVIKYWIKCVRKT